jgi:septal ring factor EnvC (AmiA/AmiB activator)
MNMTTPRQQQQQQQQQSTSIPRPTMQSSGASVTSTTSHTSTNNSNDNHNNNHNNNNNNNATSPRKKKPQSLQRQMSALFGFGKSQSPKSGVTTTTHYVKEKDVKKITDMGFTKDEALWALLLNNSDVQRAIDCLANMKKK